MNREKKNEIHEGMSWGELSLHGDSGVYRFCASIVQSRVIFLRPATNGFTWYFINVHFFLAHGGYSLVSM
jgi:hypothetical protein